MTLLDVLYAFLRAQENDQEYMEAYKFGNVVKTKDK